MSALYDQPLLYDVAFSWRDYAGEAAALVGWFERTCGRQPRSFLELAAGPGCHAIEMARRGIAATALDAAPAMCAYARGKSELLGAPVEVACADMTTFDLGRRFELAALPMNSVAHLYDLDALLAHLAAVARHLEPGGLFVIEALHPRDFVGRGPRPPDALLPWTVERYGLSVHVRWGSTDDPYDPTTQIFRASVALDVRSDEGEAQLRHTVAMRDWTRTELEAAVRLSQAFDLVAVRGGLVPDLPFNAAAEARRLVLVLRRR